MLKFLRSRIEDFEMFGPFLVVSNPFPAREEGLTIENHCDSYMDSEGYLCLLHQKKWLSNILTVQSGGGCSWNRTNHHKRIVEFLCLKDHWNHLNLMILRVC